MDFNHRMDASEASALEQTWRTGNNYLMGVERFELPKPQGNWVTASPDSPSPENTHIALQGGLEPP